MPIGNFIETSDMTWLKENGQDLTSSSCLDAGGANHINQPV